MAQLLYYIIMAAFAIIPILLAVFFFIARTSDSWGEFTLDTSVLPIAEALRWALVALMLAAALWTTLKG